VNADIAKYYSQVRVPEEQQPLLAFLWSPTPTTKPDVWVYTRHPFGTPCAPAAAISALHRTAEENPSVENIIKRSFYMDDFYWSTHSERHLIEKSQELEQVLIKDGFPLAQWASNSHKVQSVLCQEETPLQEKAFDLDQSAIPAHKVLGMIWDCKNDTITFRTRVPADQPPPRKVREALKLLASTYDPLGVIAPFVLKGKRVWQQIWNKTKDYNKEIPEDLLQEFVMWMEGLHAIKDLSIPRWLGFPKDAKVELHIASDAAITGMAAVAYFVQRGGPTMFVAAKTRVTPQKEEANIPRLELQAFVLASRLMSTILEEARELAIDQVVLWSDSMVTLQWVLGTQPSKKVTFSTE